MSYFWGRAGPIREAALPKEDGVTVFKIAGVIAGWAAAAALSLSILAACIGGMPGPKAHPSRHEDEGARKTVSGTWVSSCATFTEGDATLSELKTLVFKPRSTTSRTEVFHGAGCAGKIARAESFANAIDPQNALALDDEAAVVELTATEAADYAAYRLILRVMIAHETLTARTMRMSYWERGQEFWVPEEDLELLPPTEYHRLL